LDSGINQMLGTLEHADMSKQSLRNMIKQLSTLAL